MNLNRLMTGAVLLSGVCAGQASADLREHVTFAQVASEASCTRTTLTATFSGGYAVKQVVVSATLAGLSPSTLASEALVQVYPPRGAPFVIQPFTSGVIFGTVSVSDMILTLPVPIAAGDSAGTWSFRFFESFDDGGPDARWDNLQIQLDDGPPPAIDLGTLGQLPTHINNKPVAAGSVVWYKFTLDGTAAAGGGFLDIDTEGSQIEDTEIALFDAQGRFINTDDDDASGHYSQLTFGAGTRPPVGNGQSYNGRDGALQPGLYYLAVSAFNTEYTEPAGWQVAPQSTVSGTIDLHIRTNTGSLPPCLADFNHDSFVNSQDFFDFVTAFFTGCP